MNTYYFNSPLSDSMIKNLKIGDLVYFSGQAFTCRSKLQEYAFDQNHALPFSTKKRNLLIHAGPVVTKTEDTWKLVSFSPTSSIRFEKWGSRSIKEWGLKAIIGKTTMRDSTVAAMKEYGCVHLTVQSVSPNLWLDSIEIQDVYLLDELGSIEAAWQLELDNLGPFLVDIDSRGDKHFETINDKLECRKKGAYKQLNIPEGFTYTKLY